MLTFISILILTLCMSNPTATADTTPPPIAVTVDSLVTQCETLRLNHDSVVAAFQTMDALLAAERIYYERSSAVDSQKAYYYATIDGESTLQYFAQKLSCTLPPSLITNPDYYLVITYRLSDDYGDKPCRILDMNAYNHTTDYHLPIVRLTYCPSTGARYYEYVTDNGTVHYTIE